MMEHRQVTLSGAAGFLGRHLLRCLLDEGANVYAITSKTRAALQEAAGIASNNSQLKVIAPDDIGETELAINHSDVFINCAFPRNTDGEMLAKGLSYISNLFTLASKSTSASVINISSQSVYSQTREKEAGENTPVCLESPYAVAKYSTELLLNSCCQEIPHTNVRLASLIGPSFDQRALNKMIKRAMEAKELRVTDDKSQFGYLDVRDAVSGLLKMCRSESRYWDETYNLGPDYSYSIPKMAEAVRKTMLAKGIEVTVDVAISGDERWVNTQLDSRKFKHAFSWAPQQTLTDSINSIIDVYEKQRSGPRELK